jgi:hypothetical protein
MLPIDKDGLQEEKESIRFATVLPHICWNPVMPITPAAIGIAQSAKH